MEFLRSPPPHTIRPHIGGPAASSDSVGEERSSGRALAAAEEDHLNTSPVSPSTAGMRGTFNSISALSAGGGYGSNALGSPGSRSSSALQRASFSGSSSGSHSPALYPPSPHSAHDQALVLRGSELAAFTGALREMVRTNQVRATRQQQLNETNAQMHAMSFFLHYCNAERSLRAKREYDQVRASIEEGRSMLAQMSTVVASQEVALASLGSSMAAMESRAEATAERVGVVEDELDAQKAALAQAMAEYEARLAAQERDMRAQEAVLARLLSVRFKMDFGLDTLLALLSWYVAHNSLVRVVANHVAMKLLFRAGTLAKRVRRDRARTFTTVVQLVLFALLLRRARRWAQEAGLHHAIGSYTKYAQFLAQMCGSTIDIVRGGAPAAVSLDDDEAQEDKQRAAAAAAAADGHASGPATAAAASSCEGSNLPMSVNGVPRPPSPDFSASAALNLGRNVGAALLTGLRTGRDAVRWTLRHVVASSANPDMDVSDVQHQQHSDQPRHPLVRPIPLPPDSAVATEEMAHMAAMSSLPTTPTRAQYAAATAAAAAASTSPAGHGIADPVHSTPGVNGSAFHAPHSELSSLSSPRTPASGVPGVAAQAHARDHAAPAPWAPSAPAQD